MTKQHTETMPENASFEDAMQKLEQLIQTLEKGDLPLDKAMQVFEEGVKAHDRCKKLLEQAEVKLEKIIAAKGGEGLTSEAMNESDLNG